MRPDAPGGLRPHGTYVVRNVPILRDHLRLAGVR